MGVAIGPIGSGIDVNSPSTELHDAQHDLDQLDKLQVTEDTYRLAESQNPLDWISGRTADARSLLAQQSELEHNAQANLAELSAGTVKNQLSLEELASAKRLEQRLSTRLGDDYQDSYQNDTRNGPISANESSQATIDIRQAQDKEKTISGGLYAPADVISTTDTTAFMTQATKLEEKIANDDRIVRDSHSTKAEKDAALARLKGEDQREWNQMNDKLHAQVGDLADSEESIAVRKFSTLPLDDAQREVYVNQYWTLRKLEYSDSKFNDASSTLDNYNTP